MSGTALGAEALEALDALNQALVEAEAEGGHVVAAGTSLSWDGTILRIGGRPYQECSAEDVLAAVGLAYALMGMVTS